jgi:hypothetical protein
MTDDTITAPVGNFGTLSGSLTGTISTATRATTVDTTTAPNGTYYPGLFVSSTGIASTSVYVDAGISYDSNTNALTLDGDLAVNGGDLTTTATEFNLVNANATTVNFAGAATNLVIGSTSGITTISNDLTVGGDVRINGSDIKASDGNINITLTSNTLTAFAGDIKVGGNDIQASDGNVNITMTSNTLTEVKGDLQITGNEIKSSTTQTVITLSANDATFADNVNIIGVTTTAQLTIGTGVAVTQFSASVSTGNSTSSVPTSSAIIDYVGAQVGAVDLTFGIAGDTGTSSVNTSQTFNILGTANEIETAASAQTITIGLPNDVIVGTSLSAPTIKTATIQHSNGNQAATIDVSGNIVASQNLTVTGNLFVNGSTTQVNTETLTVEDRLIEAGKVQNTPPSDSTWDVGILFNYYKSNANKRAGVFWDDSVSRLAFASETSVTNDSGTASTDPLVSVTTWAPIEIGSLWVNDCAGQSQVISCTGTERFLENITVDAGTF